MQSAVKIDQTVELNYSQLEFDYVNFDSLPMGHCTLYIATVFCMITILQLAFSQCIATKHFNCKKIKKIKKLVLDSITHIPMFF